MPAGSIATDKETGAIVWDKSLLDQAERLTELTAAPLALKDSIVVGGSGGDHGVRNWVAALDPKTGEIKWKTYSIPAPGEPGSETWKDNHNAWQTGGGAFYVTGAYDPAANLTYWGSGNPVPAYDSSYRPGDNLYTTARSPSMPRAARSGGTTSTRPTTTATTTRPAATSSSTPRSTARTARSSSPGRNGFEYTFDRAQRAVPQGGPDVQEANWTKGIDPKTGKPLDYDPARDIQLYAEPANAIATSWRARSARLSPAAPISGRPPTAARPASSTSRPSRAAAGVTPMSPPM